MITFNGVEPPQQPNAVNENPIKIRTDTYAIDGTPSRSQMPSKENAVITYKMATIETFRFYKALYDAVAQVTYRNTQSNVVGGVLEFSGIIDFDEEEYMRGGSLMVPLTITVTQGVVVGA